MLALWQVRCVDTASAYHVDTIEAHLMGDPGAEAVVDSGSRDEIFCLQHLSEFGSGGHSRRNSSAAIAVIMSHTEWRRGLSRLQRCFGDWYESTG